MNNSQSRGQGTNNFVKYKDQFITCCRYSSYNPQKIISQFMSLLNNVNDYFSSLALQYLIDKYRDILLQIPNQLRIAKQQYGNNFNIDLNKKIDNIHQIVNECKNSIDVLVAAKQYVNTNKWNIRDYRGNKSAAVQRYNKTVQFIHNIFGRLKKKNEAYALIVLEVYTQINKFGDYKLKILNCLIKEAKTDLQKDALQIIINAELSYRDGQIENDLSEDNLTEEQKYENFLKEVLGE